jgi:5-methylcytosine-specific restriction endonuclease McrA
VAVGYGVPVPKSQTARKRKQTKRDKETQWQRVRQACKVRDGGRCRVCHSRDGADVHHIKLRSAGGVDSTANCACLCRVCHEDVHGYRLALEGNANGKLKITRLR